MMTKSVLKCPYLTAQPDRIMIDILPVLYK